MGSLNAEEREREWRQGRERTRCRRGMGQVLFGATMGIESSQVQPGSSTAHLAEV
jgi:uncharacterized cupin superfamily protein